MYKNLYTSNFWYSCEEAISWSRELSKESKTYFTPIKGEPATPEIPEECWAITNKYDPIVRLINAI